MKKKLLIHILTCLAIILLSKEHKAQKYDCSTELNNGFRGPCYLNCVISADRKFAYISIGHQWNDRNIDAEAEKTVKKYDLSTGTIVEEFQQERFHLTFYDHVNQKGFPMAKSFEYIQQSPYGKIAFIDGKAPNGTKGKQVFDFQNNKTLWLMPKDDRFYKTEFNEPNTSKTYGDYKFSRSKLRFSKDNNYFYLENEVIDLKAGTTIYAKNIGYSYLFKSDEVGGHFIYDRGKFYEYDERGKYITEFKGVENEDIYPIDSEKAWVFKRHHTDHHAFASKSSESKTAGLYLISLKDGELIDQILFDFQENIETLEEQAIAEEEYFFQKQIMIQQKLPELEESKAFYNEMQQVNVFQQLNDDGLMFIGSACRGIMWDIRTGKPLRLSQCSNDLTYTHGKGGMKVNAMISGAIEDKANKVTYINFAGNGIYKYNNQGGYEGLTIRDTYLKGINDKGQGIATKEEDILLINLNDGSTIRRLSKFNKDKQALLISEAANYFLIQDKNSKKIEVSYLDGRNNLKVSFDKGINYAVAKRDLILGIGYIDPFTFEEVDIGYKPKHNNAINSIVGDYLLSYVEGIGIEVFSLIEKKKVTSQPVFTDLFGTKFPNISKMAYIKGMRSILVVSGRYHFYKNKKKMSAYTININTGEMTPYHFSDDVKSPLYAKKPITLTKTGRVKKLNTLSSGFRFDYQNINYIDLGDHEYLVDRFGKDKGIFALGNVTPTSNATTTLMMIMRKSGAAQFIDFYLVEFSFNESILRTQLIGSTEKSGDKTFKLADVSITSDGGGKVVVVQQINPKGGGVLAKRKFRVTTNGRIRK